MEPDVLFNAIKQWGRDKGINNADKQTLKLLEESGELASELCRGRYKNAEVKDALGDIGVVWVILADILGYDAIDCLSEAYHVIENRKGKNISGSFVKEA